MTRSFLVLALATAVFACDQDSPTPVEPVYEGPTLDLGMSPENATYCQGSTRLFTVRVAWLGEGHPPMVPPEVRWSSSDPEVLTIDEQGMAEARAPGVARVRVMAGWPETVLVWKTTDVTVEPGEAVYVGGREIRPGLYAGGERKCVVGG